MASGVTVSEEAKQAYQGLKTRRRVDGKVAKWVMFTLNDRKTEIVVEKTSSDPVYEHLIEELPDSSPRWVVYDYEYDLGEAGKRNKLLLISWVPDTARIKERMVFASSSNAFKQELGGLAEVQATALDELDADIIKDRHAK